MPPQSRSQRRRSSQRPAPRPARAASPEALEPDAIALDDQPAELHSPEPIARAAAAPPRPQRSARRTSRPPEPVDYSQDYAVARRDMTRILIISTLLLAVMIGLSFAGVL